MLGTKFIYNTIYVQPEVKEVIYTVIYTVGEVLVYKIEFEKF